MSSEARCADKSVSRSDPFALAVLGVLLLERPDAGSRAPFSRARQVLDLLARQREKRFDLDGSSPSTSCENLCF